MIKKIIATVFVALIAFRDLKNVVITWVENDMELVDMTDFLALMVVLVLYGIGYPLILYFIWKRTKKES